MSKSVRSQALSAVMRIFNKAALQAELHDPEDDKKKKKPVPARKPSLDTDLSSIADGVLSSDTQ
jgi:hypothetical protein